ncbi:PE family protein [Mycolicibacterium sp. CBMA 226]|uniref:PE family protein n=1 Tax=Mycolicibacterium sp. CBMA 226 TaxID=2606611 RepID=UPI0012DCC425|nr:PE domain-containing protein [Mycolicibacterium sp. CBMA 226]MUL78879.1 PE family protein [Mycolicibacterium sp. CBMA 226]QGW61178.1 hypothetical protein ICEMyc226_00146 [Mycolicibacterium sp.]
MPTTTGLSLQPDEVADATKQLEALAARIEHVMRAEAPALTVTAPGRDEVSQRVATTLNEVHSDFSTSADAGVGQLRGAALTLRAHNDRVVDADQDTVV